MEEVGMRKGSASVTGDKAESGRSRARHRSARATPRRTCVVCRTTTAKRTLHRIVRSPAGTVSYDPTGKAAGRGAYLCGQPDCLDMAVRRRSIQRALKVTDAVAANAAVEELRKQLLSERVALASRPIARATTRK